MPHSLVLHQSYCCKVKYSEKQISFSHGNLYVLHLLSTFLPVKTWLSAQNRIFSSTSIDTTLMGQVLPNRKSLDFDYLKLRQMRCYIYIQNSQMNLASGAGNPGWSWTRWKLAISFAQNFFKNSLNQSVIRDHLGNYLVNNVIVSGDVLMAQLYNNIQEGFYFCNNNN